MKNNASAADHIGKLLSRAGLDGETSARLQNAAGTNPAVEKALSHLTESDIARISALLGDQEALTRLLSTPKARAILKKWQEKSGT